MAEMCWAPECDRVLPPPKNGRPRRYCGPPCKMRAMRRNGGTAPEVPYPPYEPLPDAPAATESLHQVTPGVTVPAIPPKEGPTGTSTPPRPKRRRRPKADAVSAGESGVVAAPPAAAAPLPEGPADRLDAGSDPDDLDPRKPVVPVPLVKHPMVEAYRADLTKLGVLDTRDGQKILEMAAKLVSAAASPAASANLSKELDRLMLDLEAKAQPATGETDAFNVIRERTLRKLGVVGVRDRLPA